MKILTTDVLRVCCVVLVLDSFSCGESVSQPDDNNVFQINPMANNSKIILNSQTEANNTLLTRNNTILDNDTPVAKNNTRRVTSPYSYDSRTLDSQDGYVKPHETSMKCPVANDVAGPRKDEETSGQTEYYKETTGQVITNTDVMRKYAPLTCPAYPQGDIMSFVYTNLDPKGCLTTQYQYEIRIKNNRECSRGSFVNVNSSTFLSVEVDGAVSNCSHEITLSSPWTLSNIILKFLDFDAPGQKNSPEPTCIDTLEIFEVYKLGNNGSVLSHKDSGPYCDKLRTSSYGLRYIQHDQAKLLLRISEQTQCMHKIRFKVIALPCSQIPDESCDGKEFAGLTYGEITSPGFSAKKQYPNNVVCKWNISVPQGHFILLKASMFDIGKGDIFSITAINKNPSLQFPEVLSFSDQSARLLSFVVVPSNECVLEFRSDEFMTGHGFNVTFQSVAKTRFLPLLDDNLFNCSGIIDIPDSIRCTFLSDCVDGQDEVNCPYKHPDCPGGYVFDDTCYRIQQYSGEKFSWNSARAFCEKNFLSTLVTFKTESKRFFLDKLQNAHRTANMFLGLTRKHGRNMYARVWSWTDGTVAFYLPDELRSYCYSGCGLFRDGYFETIDCDDIFENITIVCEKTLHLHRNRTFPKLAKPQSRTWTEKLDVFTCGSGEVISIDRRCDRNANCFDKSDEENCGDYMEYIRKRFTCDNLEMVAYTFVCDGVDYDCLDNSDENFCSGYHHSREYNHRPMKINQAEHESISFDYDTPHQQCPENTTSCPGLYCMPDSWITDGEIDCPIRDWRGKKMVEETLEAKMVKSIPPPGIIFPDGYGKFVIKALEKTDQCPPTHVQCLEGFCIPMTMFGNGYQDCPYHEDEGRERQMDICDGAYKCRRRKMCIGFHQLCDGNVDCPYNDDETLCKTGSRACPIGCTCVQNEFVCTGSFRFDRQPLIKAHSFSISLNNISSFKSFKLESSLLIYLEASRTAIKTVEDEDFRYPNLKVLKLSNNQIKHLSQSAFKHCLVLERLSLEGNFIQDLSFLKSTPNIKALNLSHNTIQILNDKTFVDLTKLETLKLRNMGIREIRPGAFLGLCNLKTLDLKGNEILTFSTRMFSAQLSLSLLITDNFRLCCKQIAPSRIFTKGKCVTSHDDISSCHDMLRTGFLRTSLWVMAILTILGNVGVICHRMFWDKSNRLTYRVLITCLSLSDLTMGVYLVIIGIADVKYRHRFLSAEEEWKDSTMCRVAGHLCVLSSEVSALLILVVTVDRAIAIALPLRRELHMSNRSVGIVCVFVWLAGMTIASIPIVPPFNSWKLYSQLAVGVPLPLTRNRFPGYEFAFAIFIVLNVTTFIFVVFGQLVIWLAIKKRSKVLMTQARMKQDLAIAQKLFLVVLTDCVCWFPISVMGLLAFRGIAVPGTMHIVATVFLLPANSALNPFLYTLNSLLHKNRKKLPPNAS